MIDKALEFLVNLGRKDVAPVPVVKDDPRTERYLVSGQSVEIEKPNPPRNHMINSLADVIAMADSSVCNPESAAVFYSEASVILMLDYNEHRVEWAKLVLRWSDSWNTVQDLGKWLEGKALIRLLRTDLAGCIPDAALVDIIRRVKFENGQTVTTENQRNRESLGKEITSKISTAVEIPDRVTLVVPVYSSLGEQARYPIQCSLEIEPARIDAFQLKPLPDEPERVQQLAMQSIAERLQSGLPEGIPFYYGSP